jgi:hypothetical protein
MQYTSIISYQYVSGEEITLLLTASKILGFEPKYMSLFFDEFEGQIDDIPFDIGKLMELIKRKPATITIKNKLYEEAAEGNVKWFRFSQAIDTPFDLKTVSLEWSNSNLDFLLTNSEFKVLMSSKNLLYCYCYNQLDCMQQSNTTIKTFLNDYPNLPFKIAKNHLGDDIVDISEHWGRYIKVQDLFFVAAPLMWFGKSFFQIISRNELLSFKESSIVNFEGTECIYIVLFDLYDNPSKKENREAQERFWKLFMLKHRIEKYELDHPVDYMAWIRDKKIRRKNKKIK